MAAKKPRTPKALTKLDPKLSPENLAKLDPKRMAKVLNIGSGKPRGPERDKQVNFRVNENEVAAWQAQAKAEYPDRADWWTWWVETRLRASLTREAAVCAHNHLLEWCRQVDDPSLAAVTAKLALVVESYGN